MLRCFLAFVSPSFRWSFKSIRIQQSAISHQKADEILPVIHVISPKNLTHMPLYALVSVVCDLFVVWRVNLAFGLQITKHVLCAWCMNRSNNNESIECHSRSILQFYGRQKPQSFVLSKNDRNPFSISLLFIPIPRLLLFLAIFTTNLTWNIFDFCHFCLASLI